MGVGLAADQALCPVRAETPMRRPAPLIAENLAFKIIHLQSPHVTIL
jgi:hypothetical protein